ncbi:MAG: glycoside hydrolase family 32 protein [Chloroflexales bacterium]|nr:glycoside hydrolase family 32 protein [Chloroflexales bacterium]
MMNPRNQFASDPHLPRYHFTAPQGWLNDPNGLIHWRGEYHLFYQFNPHGAFWGAMHWGHAVSTDLVHWTDLPIALAPDMPYDRAGVFSGCTTIHDGKPVIMYTGVNSPHQLPCVAYADDNLRTFTKAPQNPVIGTPPDNLVEDFRDHSMWRDGEWWYQIIGSGDGTHAVAPIFRSKDLLSWEYLGRMIESEDAVLEKIYECPDFFASNNQHVFITSPLPMKRVIWMSGAFDGRKFVPSQRNMVDWGMSFYAPQSFSDADGRRIMIGWCQEQRNESSSRAAGWQGVMTLPRIIALDDAGALTFTVAPEVVNLEGSTITHGRDLTVSQAQTSMAHVAGDSLVIHARIAASGDARTIFVLRHDPQSSEQTTVTWDRGRNELVCDMAQSSLNQNTSHDCYRATLHASVADELELHIYIDHSIIEIYAGAYTVCTLRVYPTHAANRYQITASGDVSINELIVRHMA